MRRVLEMLGVPLVKALAHVTVSGMEHFPKRGAYIIAGNHSALIEVLLMVAVCPRQPDIIGAGDIPLDPRFRWLADLYGYIPYKRGSTDMGALKTARRRLEDGGVVGIFPEGGIWKSGHKDAQKGVAWLSHTAGVPVIPLGFSGITGAIGSMLTLKHPSLEVRVGTPIPPPDTGTRGKRAALDRHATLIMDRIEELAPEHRGDSDEAEPPPPPQVSLTIRTSQDAAAQPADAAPQPADAAEIAAGLSPLYELPVLLDVFARNLHRPVQPLQQTGAYHDAPDMAEAAASIQRYLSRRNSAFFSYRIGAERAAVLEASLTRLRSVSEALPHGSQVRIDVVVPDV